MPRVIASLLLCFSLNTVIHATESPEKMTARFLCFGCHAVDEVRAGPAFQDIALRYQQQPAAIDTLMHSVQHGSVGKWGNTPMPAVPVPDNDLKFILRWILQQTP